MEIRQLQLRIHEVKIVLGAFSDEAKKLMRMRYLEKYSKDLWVSMELHIPLRSYYRLRDELVEEAAVMFGYLTREQLSLEEFS